MVGDLLSGRAAPPARPESRSRRRPLLAACLLIALLGGCSGPARPGETSGSTEASRGSAAGDLPVDCADVRSVFACHTVTVGARTYRFAVAQRPGATPSKEAVLVDLGGPGRALFGSADLLDFAKLWPGDETLIALEEPWVTQPVSLRCSTALRSFYRSVHDPGAPGPQAAEAVTLAPACSLARAGRWGWSATTYRAVALEAVTDRGLVLTGLVATSYGATRLPWVWGLPGVQWSILDSPAPLTATGRDYVRARVAGAVAAVEAACTDCAGPGGANQAITSAAVRLAAAPEEIDTRTPPVNGSDALAAAMAIAYLPPTERPGAVVALGKAPGPGSGASAVVGTLSDSLLMRYGTYDMSPGLLAYYQEVCEAFAPWSGLPGSTRLARFFSGLHRPCAEMAGEAAGAATGLVPGASPSRSCISRSSEDFVTSRSFADQWSRALPGARSVALPGLSHGAPELAAACYRALMRR